MKDAGSFLVCLLNGRNSTTDSGRTPGDMSRMEDRKGGPDPAGTSLGLWNHVNDDTAQNGPNTMERIAIHAAVIVRIVRSQGRPRENG